MPFNQTTGSPFTESGILASAPKSSGVYGIFKSGRWIYVGEAEDIETRLLSHVKGESDQSYCIKSNGATHFVYELVAGELARKGREKFLIAELSRLATARSANPVYRAGQPMEVYFETVYLNDCEQITDAHFDRGVRDSRLVITFPHKARKPREIA